MPSFIRDYWYLYLLLVLMTILTVYAMIRVRKELKKKNIEYEKQMEELKRFNYLKEKYASLDKKSAEAFEAKEVAEGVTAALQSELEKSGNFDLTFKNAEHWRKTVYSLFYFGVDSSKSLSFFFKNNGEPLTSLAVNGLSQIGENALYELVKPVFDMLDENNETVSLDRAALLEADKSFASLFDSESFYENIKNFVIKNI